MLKIGKIFLTLLLTSQICSANSGSSEKVVNIADFSHGGMHLQYYLNNVLGNTASPLPEDIRINITAPGEDFKLQPGTVMAADLPDIPIPQGAEVLTVGRMPIVAAVAKSNPLDEITAEQLRLIYTGRIQLWNDLKISYAGLIVRAGPPDHSPLGRIFRCRVMGQDLYSPAPPPPGKDILPGVRIITQRKTAEAMAQLQDGILIIGGWELVNSPHLKILKVNGVKPTRDTILNGQYLLYTDHKFIVHPANARDLSIKQIFNFFRRNALQSGNML